MQEFAKKNAEQVDLVYLREMSKLLLQHEDLQKFVKQRMEMQVKPITVEINYTKDAQFFATRREYHMAYVNPSLWSRLNFYVFDFALWLKQKMDTHSRR